MAQLVVVEGPDRGKIFPLPGPVVVIGREAGCDLVLQDRSVSRSHCEIRKEGSRWIVTDLGSSNKTFVNDDPVTSCELSDGDLLGVGDTELRFEGDEERISEEELKTQIRGSYRLRGRATSPVLESRRLLEKLSLLAELGQLVDRAEDSRELLRVTLKELLGAVGAHWGVALIRDGAAWRMQCRAGAQVKHAVSKTLLQRLLEGEDAVLCADVTADPVLQGQRSIQQGSVQAVVAAPLRSSGRLLGALYFAKREGTFAQDDMFLVAGACNQIAVLLKNFLTREALLAQRQNLIEQIQKDNPIVGKSAAMRRVLEFVARAAPSDATVLISGETGTGKELVASAIHYASPRAGKPFVQLNCAAIPENLLESELFGHEKGAFTSATSLKRGHFEVAGGGTVFLDEVGELSPSCQAKVLRLIEEKRFERVGGTESICVDVRIVAATNQDLRKAVAEGAFREDLYWRLDVLHIEIPPLRERPEDILLLAEYFLDKVRGPGGKRLQLAPDAREALLAYRWPGNVRQLRNVIENAVVMSTGEELRAQDLRLVDFSAPGKSPVTGTWRPCSLAEVEKEHVLRVLEFTKGNKKRAAEILGIERGTLYSRLRAYGVLREKRR